MIGLAVSVACRSSVEAVVQATMQQQQQSPGQAASPGRAGAAEQGLVPKLMAWAGTAAGEQLVLKVVSIFTRQVRSPAPPQACAQSLSCVGNMPVACSVIYLAPTSSLAVTALSLQTQGPTVSCDASPQDTRHLSGHWCPAGGCAVHEQL